MSPLPQPPILLTISENANDNSSTSFMESPLETLLDTTIEQMDINELRHHLAKLRELTASAVKRNSVLREESEAIKTRTPRKPKLDISELY